MKTTAIMNLKGGTGKTITAINAAAIMGKLHARNVLLIDADSQGNLTEFVAMNPEDVGNTPGTAALLKGNITAPIETKLPNAWLIPGDDDLMDLDITASKNGGAKTSAIMEMTETAAELGFYDNVLIDCPPAFNAAAIAALIAADEVLIPVKLDAFGMRGMARLVRLISTMQKVNPDLEIAGVLPTMYYSCPVQQKAEQDLREAMRLLGIRVFPHIRRSTLVDGSTFAQEPLIYFSPKSGACRDYKIFVRELIGEEADINGV